MMQASVEALIAELAACRETDSSHSSINNGTGSQDDRLGSGTCLVLIAEIGEETAGSQSKAT